MRLYFEKRVLIGFFVALAIIIGLGIYSYFNNQKFTQTSNLVTHTNKVLFHSEQVRSLIMDIESSQRGYVLSGEKAFLETFEESRKVIEDHLHDLGELTVENPLQQERILAIHNVIAEKIKYAEKKINARNTSGGNFQENPGSLRGKYLMDSIRLFIGQFQEYEKQSLQQGIQDAGQTSKEFTYAFTGMLVVTAIILIVVFLTINFNLVARTQAENELRKASDEIRDMYENAPCGYHSVDARGKFIEMNKTMLNWLGYTAEDVVGKLAARDVMTPAGMATFEKNFPIFKSQGYISNLEFEFKRQDGTAFPVIVNSVAVYNSAGEYVRSRTSVFDITERKHAENRIRQLNHELEAFTYSVSHDLRAPLRSIDGYTKILQEDYSQKLDEEGIRVMNVIINNAKRMGQLIDDLLEFSRLGRKDLAKTDCDMATIASTVLKELVDHNQERKVSVTVHEIVNCPADLAMIRLVWTNLISNALKYSNKKQNPVIEISSYVSDGMAVYSVRDNGAGFDMQYVGKLFGVFQRLHKVQDFEGTGVGLAIVYRIITKHGGKVWAEGKVNEGATFSFALPLKKTNYNYLKNYE